MSLTLTPRDEAELASAVATSRADRTPLAVTGSGTKAGVGRPAQAGATLSVRGLTGITLYEPAEMVIGARAGTPLAELERTLAERGQQFPFEPPDFRPLLGSGGEPTIGGLAAANLSGPRRPVAGACRDHLIGIRLVNGRGEIVKTGGRVMKNVTGLDLVKLGAGSWGTLGVFSEVTFKVLPRPEKTASLVFHALDDARALRLLARALGTPFEVSGAAHLPSGIDRIAKTVIRLEGFAPSIAYRLGELRRELREFGSPDQLDGDLAESLWRAVRDATFLAEPRDRAVWRLSIAPSKAGAAVAALRDRMAVRHFYDWGGGLVWIATDPAGDAGAAAIREVTRPVGAHATLWRAPAEIRAAVDVFEPLAEPLMAVTRGVKASFDPDRILNPGRMYAGV
jgi:glycolate oxidase FAD binding subunit